jgi:hypothetical protein
MLKSWKRIGMTVVATGVTVLGLSGLALVQPVAAAQREAAAAIVAEHAGGGGGLHSEAGLAAAADALGLTVEELQTQLWAGESLADLADAAGVDLQVVQDAVTAANVQAARDEIAQAVTDGTMTQDKADWLIEGLDAGYWGGAAGPGFGPGFGFGHGGPRPFGGPDGAPDAAPTTVAPTINS